MLASHGLFLEDVKAIAEGKPAIKPLAVLQTTKKTWDPIARTSHLGATHGLIVIRETKPKYWVPTHDESVTGTGVYLWFVKDTEISDKNFLNTKLSDEGCQLATIENGKTFVLSQNFLAMFDPSA